MSLAPARPLRMPAARQAMRGLTLIELMVALLISMILTLAVFAIIVNFEGRRRTLSSTTDLDRAGALAMFQIDGWVRSAGTGFAGSDAYAYGCVLHAAKAGVQLLPTKAALAAPFAGVDPGAAGVFRLAPALILPGQTTPGASGKASDVLVLMSGGAGGGADIAARFAGAAASDRLNLVTSLPFNANDLVLLADQQPGSDGGLSPCLLTQAAAGFGGGAATAMPLAGSWYAQKVGPVSVQAYSDSAVALNLGNVDQRQAPQFQLIGVGDHDTLFSYDLLQASDEPLQARAQGVFELHALYGVDTDGDGKLDAWVAPTDSAWSVAALSAGTGAAAAQLKRIKALRVGLILRSPLPDREAVTPDTLKLFADVEKGALTVSRRLSADERRYRYRVLETTVPLRNNLL